MNGSRRSASAGASADVEHDEAEIAGLEHERERRIACSSARWFRSRHSPGLRDDVAANPQQTIEIDAGGGRRLDVEHVERIDQRRPARRARSPPPASAAAGWCVPTIAAPTSSTAGRAETRRRDARPTRNAGRRDGVSSRGSSGRQRRRQRAIEACAARSSDSRSARARAIAFSLYLRLTGEL